MMMNTQTHQNLPYQEQESYTFPDQIQPHLDETSATFNPFSSSSPSFTYLPYQEQQLVPYDDHAQPYRSWEDEYVDMMNMLTDFSPTMIPSSSTSSSTLSSSPTTTTNDHLPRPQGMRFRPTPVLIFDFLLPTRLFYGQDAQELQSYKDVVMEINLYGSGESAEEIFGGSEEKDFYFFTKLEKANRSRIKRKIQGKGTWSCKSGTHEHVLEIQGQNFKVGTTRQFYNACKDDTISYIMHEYLPNQDFLIYKANQMNILNFDINNVERIAFCYIYKRVEKSILEKRKLDDDDDDDVSLSDILDKIKFEDLDALLNHWNEDIDRSGGLSGMISS